MFTVRTIPVIKSVSINNFLIIVGLLTAGDVVVVLLAGALHLSTLLVDVVEGSYQSNVEHGQRRQRYDQHEDGVQHVTVDDEVEPVVHQRCVNGARDAVVAVLETTFGELRCVV